MLYLHIYISTYIYIYMHACIHTYITLHYIHTYKLYTYPIISLFVEYVWSIRYQCYCCVAYSFRPTVINVATCPLGPSEERPMLWRAMLGPTRQPRMAGKSPMTKSHCHVWLPEGTSTNNKVGCDHQELDSTKEIYSFCQQDQGLLLPMKMCVFYQQKEEFKHQEVGATRKGISPQNE